MAEIEVTVEKMLKDSAYLVEHEDEEKDSTVGNYSCMYLPGFDFTRNFTKQLYYYGLDFSNCHLEDAVLDGMSFRNCNFSFAMMKGASMVQTDFTRCNLSNVQLRDAKMMFASFDHCNLKRAKLNYADIRQVNFYRSELIDINIDFSSWPMWCGTKNSIVGEKLAQQIAAHFCALICDDPETKRMQALLLDYARNSHRANYLLDEGEGEEDV